MSLLLSPLLSLLDPRGVFLGCRPFKPSDFVRSFGFRSCCCLFCLFWIRGVCSYVAGLSSPATSFAPSVSATISLFFYVLSSCSSSFFCASSGSFFIFGASCLFSAYGYFGFSLLRSRGAMVVRGFRERRRLRLPMRCRGVVCLIRFRQAYILTRLHFRGGGGGGGSDNGVRSEATGAFRKVLSFIASFFPNVLPLESQPPSFYVLVPRFW